MHIFVALAENPEFAAIISIIFLAVIVIPALWFIARELISVGRTIRGTVSRDEMHGYQEELTRLERQISDWLAFDHVRRSEYLSAIEKLAVNTERITRIEAWEERIKRLENRINGHGVPE